MTVASETSRVSYSGDGSTTVFSVPFYFLNNADLKVYLRVNATGVETLQTITTHYSVTGAGVLAGGSVTMVTAPATGQTLVIYRDPSLTQQTDYVGNDPFPAETHERALDKLTMLVQRLSSRFSRAITLKETSSYSALTIPDPESSKLLRWKSDLSGLENATATQLGALVEATQAQAEAGTDQSTFLSPLRGKQQIEGGSFATTAKNSNNGRLSTTRYVHVRETWVNAYDYVTDPLAADWKTYIDAAIAALPSGGGVVKMPVGDVPLASGLAAIANKHVRLEGFGRDVTRLRFSHAAQDCITFTHTTVDWMSEVLDMSIFAQGVNNTGSAIKCTYPDIYTEMPGPLFENLSIRGASWANDQFLRGITLTHGLRARVQKCFMLSRQFITTATLLYLIGSRNKQVSVIDCQQVYGKALLETDGNGVDGYFMEGFTVEDCETVASNYLVYITKNNNGADFKILNSHAECYIGAIYAKEANLLYVRGNSFFKRDSGADEPAPVNYTALYLDTCTDFDVSHNFSYVVDPADSPNDTFMFMTNSDGGQAKDNRIANFDFGFEGSLNSEVAIVGNRYKTLAVFAANISANSKVRENEDVGGIVVQSIAAGDTTPSVGNTYAEIFRTANTAATTITNFDDAFNCQLFTLQVNDANTTIQHNAGLLLRGGVNATPPNGSVFTFFRDTVGVWREVSRNY